MIAPVALTAATAAVVALLATPVAMAVARRTGVVARPRAERWHRRPTPLLGGLGLVAGVLAGGAVAVAAGAVGPVRAVGLAAGILIALAVGVCDDVADLGARAKLGGQVAAAVPVVATGTALPLTGVPLPDGVLTALLLVAAMNSVNLLDNMDGMAAGIAGVGALAVAAIAGGVAAALPLALAGACAGYLAWNAPLPRARVFMGDAGSLPLGLSLAAVAAWTAGAEAGLPSADVLLPLAALAVPALDTATVIAARRRAGRAVSQGGTDHLSHRLVAAGFSGRGALGVLAGLQLCAGAVAVLLLAAPASLQWAAIVTGAVVAAGIVWRISQPAAGAAEIAAAASASAGTRTTPASAGRRT